MIKWVGRSALRGIGSTSVKRGEANHWHIFVMKINIQACFKYIHFIWGIHSTPNRTVWKILIFVFLHFLTFFSTHQITLPGKFWNFFDHRFKRYFEFRFFAHNFFKNVPNSKFFILKYLLLYAIFEFENFNLVFETVCRYSSIFFYNFLF